VAILSSQVHDYNHQRFLIRSTNHSQDVVVVEDVVKVTMDREIVLGDLCKLQVLAGIWTRLISTTTRRNFAREQAVLTLAYYDSVVHYCVLRRMVSPS
jgi:hypothetical protein